MVRVIAPVMANGPVRGVWQTHRGNQAAYRSPGNASCLTEGHTRAYCTLHNPHPTGVMCDPGLAGVPVLPQLLWL